jgi:hypothetical protein
MMVDKSETVKVDKEAFDKLSTEEHAEICSMIMSALTKKANELFELYEKLSTTYKAEMSVTGISMICAINCLAFEEDDPPMQFIVGPAKGVMYTALPLMKVIKEQLLKGERHETDEAAG